jgi:hypothetical protein
MRPLPADLLHLAFVEDMGEHSLRAGDAARFGRRARLLNRILCLLFDLGPFRLRDQGGHEVGAKLWKRIARPFGSDHFLRLVGLRVLEAVPLEARHRQPEQGRPGTAAHMLHRLSQQARRLGRLGAVAGKHVEIAEACKVAGDVAARGLERRRHGNSELVVLDIEEHRQLLGGGDGKRRPEAVRRDRGIAAEHNSDRIPVRLAAQRGAIIFDRLRPARRRRILSADAARHRQGRGAAEVRVVEDDADVAAVGIAPFPSHRRGERVLDRNPERQQQRARTIIAAGGVLGPIEAGAEHDLRHVVPAREKLVAEPSVRARAAPPPACRAPG